MAAVGFIFAILIGVSLGLLGGGGSTLTIPVLHYAFGLEVHDAIASSLIVVAATGAIAVLPHARAGSVRWRHGATFGVASMATSFVGGRLGALVPGIVLIVAFAAVMMVSGLAMLLRSRTMPTPGARRPGWMVVLGGGVGVLTGFLGAGGGFLIVPALTIAGGLGMREAVATSLFVITLNALAGLAGTVAHATIDIPLTAAVTAIAIAGSLVGARLGRRMPAASLQRVFGWFVIVLATLVLVAELT